MSLPKEFFEKLPEKADEDLYDMVVHPDDYTPEAIAAATEELRRRNLPPGRMAQLEAAAETQVEFEKNRADERLGWPMRILIFFFCVGFIGAFLAVYYESKGFKKKASDCWVAMGVSIVIHLAFAGARLLSR